MIKSESSNYEKVAYLYVPFSFLFKVARTGGVGVHNIWDSLRLKILAFLERNFKGLRPYKDLWGLFSIIPNKVFHKLFIYLFYIFPFFFLVFQPLFFQGSIKTFKERIALGVFWVNLEMDYILLRRGRTWKALAFPQINFNFSDGKGKRKYVKLLKWRKYKRKSWRNDRKGYKQQDIM